MKPIKTVSASPNRGATKRQKVIECQIATREKLLSWLADLVRNSGTKVRMSDNYPFLMQDILRLVGTEEGVYGGLFRDIWEEHLEAVFDAFSAGKTIECSSGIKAFVLEVYGRMPEGETTFCDAAFLLARLAGIPSECFAIESVGKRITFVSTGAFESKFRIRIAVPLQKRDLAS